MYEILKYSVPFFILLGVVEYLSNGGVADNHKDFKELRYNECLMNFSCSGKNGSSEGRITHGFQLKSAYENNLMPYTNYTFDFKVSSSLWVAYELFQIKACKKEYKPIWLRVCRPREIALAVLSEDLSLISSTSLAAYRAFDAIFWPLSVPGIQMFHRRACRQNICTHEKNKLIDSKTNTQNPVTKNVWFAYKAKKEILLGFVFIIDIIRILF